MDMKTRYMSFELAHPFMPGAFPLADALSSARQLEDAGAPAIVLTSLFEEQLRREGLAATAALDATKEYYAEATSFLPEPDHFRIGPGEYLEKIRRIKESLEIPVIASLNGRTLGGWLDYARLIEEAGADALELNIYRIATDIGQSGMEIENESLSMIQHLKSQLKIPLAVKISPFYTSLPHFARRMDEAGIDGMILFNRFFQADIDIEELEMSRTLRLSHPSELLLRLRWLAILSGRIRASLALTGGVHTAEDAIKSVMAGAHAVQIVSSLMRRGPGHLAELKKEVVRWMEEHEYESIEQMRGSMSLERCPDSGAITRANYIYLLQNWASTLELSR